MADNYLERAMEDLKNGRLSQSISRHASNKKQYTSHIYIRDIEEYGIEKARELIRGGAKVTFSFPEGHEGSRLARTLKCFYRPASMGKPEDCD